MFSCESTGNPLTARREFLSMAAGGFGGIALADVLGRNGALADEPHPEFNGGLHHAAKVRRVIQLFMNGGASQMDLFDYKPELFRRAGEKFDPGTTERVEAATSAPGNVLKPPFEMHRRGQCGRWISDQLPHLANHVDKIAFFMAMKSKTNVHGPGSYLMNTGCLLPGFPCFGAWVSYGLGGLSDNLPTFVVLPDARACHTTRRETFPRGSFQSPTRERLSIPRCPSQSQISGHLPRRNTSHQIRIARV